MKKLVSLLIVVAMVFALTGVCGATDNKKEITVHNSFYTTAVSASGTADSSVIDLSRLKPEGYFSLQLAVTGSGTVKVQYMLSNDGTNYVIPSSATDIVTGFTSSSGPGSDGKDVFSFQPEIAKYIKLRVTETGGSSSATVTGTLAIQ